MYSAMQSLETPVFFLGAVNCRGMCKHTNTECKEKTEFAQF